MNLETLINLLNEDLTREYSHWHFYMNAAVRVIGLHREEYQEFFEKEAAGEMQHILQFSRLIIGLGGCPTVAVANFPFELDTPKDLLSVALKMEQEVVDNYVQRMDDAEELEKNGGQDKVDGRYVHIFLEDQILDSRHTVDHIRELLRS